VLDLLRPVASGKLADQRLKVLFPKGGADRWPASDDVPRIMGQDLLAAGGGDWSEVNLSRNDPRQKKHSIANQRLAAKAGRARQVQVRREQIDGRRHEVMMGGGGERGQGTGSEVNATLDDYRWLVSEAAQPWLAVADAESAGGATTGLLSRLRKDLSAERAHLAVEQIELRRRAREKFSRPQEMFFTRKGLEQATDEQLAAYKARRFASDELIADLCCGIGGDLVSLARRGPTRGVDRDAVVALLAAANLAAHGLDAKACPVIVGDVAKYALNRTAWHCDPDRRAEGRRSTRGEWFEPSLSDLAGLIAASGSAAIKLAPATEAPSEWSRDCELEWLGSRGECRQQVAWFGALARHAGQRSATIIGRTADPRTVVGEASDRLPSPQGPDRFVFEPHPAVLAARLTVALCREHGLAPIDARVAYLTGNHRIHDAALDAFEVRDVLPLDRKQLKVYCREHQLGRLEIKKRGVAVDPPRLRQEIIGRGDDEAVIIVTPLCRQVRAIVARRIPFG
jgi:THUMP domain-containing protein